MSTSLCLSFFLFPFEEGKSREWSKGERENMQIASEREERFHFQWRFTEIPSFLLPPIQFSKKIRISKALEVIFLFLFFGKEKFPTRWK